MAKATTASKVDLRAIVDSTKERISPSTFDLWETSDPKRAEEFWGHIDYARSKGCGWRLALKLWNDNRDPCPIKYEQVRIRHEARAKRADRPA